jgi:uncharacterized membrane-anchored protein YjiN (DUF445 family)
MTTISSDDMKAAVAKAVLEVLDRSKRDLLIQNALENLIAPRKDNRGYSDKPSILEETFNSELAMYARDVVREYFTQDGPMKEKLNGFIAKMVEKMLTDEEGELGKALAEAVSEAMKKLTRGY